MSVEQARRMPTICCRMHLSGGDEDVGYVGTAPGRSAPAGRGKADWRRRVKLANLERAGRADGIGTSTIRGGIMPGRANSIG